MVLQPGQLVEWKRKRNGMILTTKGEVLHQWSNKEVKLMFRKDGRLKFQSVPVSQVTLLEEVE